MIRDPRIYAATRKQAPDQPVGQPTTLSEELALISPNVRLEGAEKSQFQYETTIAMLLGAGQAHYSPVLKHLYFWGDLDGKTMKTLRSVYRGAGLSFKVRQLGMDVHRFFRCTYTIALPDSAFSTVHAALRLAGIQLLLYPIKPRNE